MISLEQVIDIVKETLDRLTNENKRRLLFVCTAGFIVILTISVIASVGKGNPEEILAEPERRSIISAIPADEVFLPDEPDFLPGVLLEREQRPVWTEQDAMEHWQDPLRYGEEQWRGKIEAAIDEILERIP